MRGYRYMHVCNHQFSSGKVEEIIDSPELFSQKGKQSVVLIDGANVIEILEVRIIKYDFVHTPPSRYDDYTRMVTYDEQDEGQGYFDRDETFFTDYSPYFERGASISNPLPPDMYRSFLHNRIEFLVNPPISFMVKMRVRYSDDAYQVYEPIDCPKCAGRGWFIDLLDIDGRFVIAEEAEHVIQDFVKILMMRVGSSALDKTNGSRIHEVVGSTLSLEAIELQLSEIVSECVENYLEQQSLIDTTDYEPTELLRDVELVEVLQHPTDPRRRIMRLLFITEAGANQFNLNM